MDSTQKVELCNVEVVGHRLRTFGNPLTRPSGILSPNGARELTLIISSPRPRFGGAGQGEGADDRIFISCVQRSGLSCLSIATALRGHSPVVYLQDFFLGEVEFLTRDLQS
jgi:hypothetical protein